MNHNKKLTSAQRLQIAQQIGRYGWQTYSFMAVLNKLIWAACESNGISQKKKKGRFVLKSGALAIANRPLSFRCPLSWIAEQMAEQFPGAKHSRDSIRRILKTMQEWGLFEMVDEKAKCDLFILDPRRAFKSPPKLFIKFNLIDAILYYERIHQIFTAQNALDKDLKRKYIKVPKHGGGFVRRLYEGLLRIRYRIYGPSFETDELPEDLEIDMQNQRRLGAATAAIAASLATIDQYKRILGSAWESSAIARAELLNIDQQHGIIATINASIEFCDGVLS
jgi:hypothetical protein